VNVFAEIANDGNAGRGPRTGRIVVFFATLGRRQAKAL
jgi:hypothetical protein